jgi:hypothetical protein
MSWILSPTHTVRKPWVWALEFFWYGDSDGISHWPSRIVGEKGVWWKSGRERGRGWRRIALVGYWATVISSAIGGWQTHLVRARRIRVRSETSKKNGAGLGKESSSLHAGYDSSTGGGSISPGGGGSRSPVSGSFAAAAASAASAANAALSGASIAGGLGEVGTSSSRLEHRFGAEGARAEKAVHASLNMRRKFFHALAVLMFVPGIAVDVRLSVFFSLLSLSREGALVRDLAD